MAKSGPENHQSSEVIPFGMDRRVRPPNALGDSARRIFVDLVGSLPSGHFKAGDIHLLARYCEAAAMAERAAAELETNGNVLTDPKTGAPVLSPWDRVWDAKTKAMAAMAPRLRLGPSARMKQASKKEIGPAPAYERLRRLVE